MFNSAYLCGPFVLSLLQFKEEEVSTCTRSATVTVPKDIVKQCFHSAVDEMQKASAGTSGAYLFLPYLLLLLLLLPLVLILLLLLLS
jgi:hypothetical protein